MKRTVLVLSLASVALAGCVAVPVYDQPVVAYSPPPAVIVGPSVTFGYYRGYGPRYYGGSRYHGGPRHHHR